MATILGKYLGYLKRYENIHWVLADQALVSGFNFTTSVLLARLLGLSQYGNFVVFYSVFLYANLFQSAFVIAPMLTLLPQLEQEAVNIYLSGSLTLQLVIAGFSFWGITQVGLLVKKIFIVDLLGWEIIVALASSVACFQLQDWLRRHYFVLNSARSAFFNDFLSYGGQVLCIILMFQAKALDIVNSLWAIAITSLFAFVVGLLTEKKTFTLSSLRFVWEKNWRLSKNLLLAGQINWLGSQGIVLLTAFILGASSAGGLRASHNIVGPLNILFQGLENIIPVKAAQQYAEKGLSGLRNFSISISLRGGFVIGVICISLSLLSNFLMLLFYGEEYQKFSSLIIWQSLSAFFAFFCVQAFYFYRTVDSSEIILKSTFLLTLTSLLLSVALGQRMQESGIVIASCISQIACLLYLCCTLFQFFERNREEKINN